MRIHRSESGILIGGLALACLIVSIIVPTYAPNQIIRNIFAANGPTTTTTTSSVSPKGSNITLGSPQLSYTEYDKTTNFKPAIINGTHGIQISFTGYGILNGINITDNGKAFITNGTAGTIYTTGRGELVSGVGSAAGTTAFTFQGIGHYGADGKLRNTGITLYTNVSGNLVPSRNMAGIYKDVIDKAGNAIAKIWLWK